MALGPRLDLRQSQSLVMTPQLQQAIKLLALSNLEIEAFIGEALESNPLLEAGEMRSVEREAPRESEEPQVHDATPGDGEQALDIDPEALDQRARTILKVAAAIVKAQDGFFRQGVSQLRPLTLRAVAEEIEMHESTVSRVTSNKYLHCDRGTFELKYFFSSGVARVGASGEGAEGEGGASAEAVKAQIRALCDAEDSGDILSDDKLVELLRAKGFDLARRTVAKYREAIGIGSSVQRRRQKKLQRVGP